jgi:hypothetical protein
VGENLEYSSAVQAACPPCLPTGFCFFSQHHFTTLYHRIHITAN